VGLEGKKIREKKVLVGIFWGALCGSGCNSNNLKVDKERGKAINSLKFTKEGDKL
jgi:hypothetical protein